MEWQMPFIVVAHREITRAGFGRLTAVETIGAVQELQAAGFEISSITNGEGNAVALDRLEQLA